MESFTLSLIYPYHRPPYSIAIPHYSCIPELSLATRLPCCLDLLGGVGAGGRSLVKTKPSRALALALLVVADACVGTR